MSPPFRKLKRIKRSLSLASTSNRRLSSDPLPSGDVGLEVGADLEVRRDGCKSSVDDGTVLEDPTATLGVPEPERRGVPQISQSYKDGWFKKVHAGQEIALGRRLRTLSVDRGVFVDGNGGAGEADVEEGKERECRSPKLMEPLAAELREIAMGTGADKFDLSLKFGAINDGAVDEETVVLRGIPQRLQINLAAGDKPGGFR